MTKHVRIENADNNRDKKIIVEMWSCGTETEPQRIINQFDLTSPTSLREIALYDGIYLVIRESDIK